MSHFIFRNKMHLNLKLSFKKCILLPSLCISVVTVLLLWFLVLSHSRGENGRFACLWLQQMLFGFILWVFFLFL